MPPIRDPVPIAQVQQLPFDAEYQRGLLKLLCSDHQFAHTVADYLEPQYFSNEIFAWAFAFCKRYLADYGSFPSLGVLKHQVATVGANSRAMYQSAIEQIEQASLRDSSWMRSKTLDFIKRNIFVRSYQESRALFNSGRTTECYDLMMRNMEKLIKTSWEPVDECDYFSEMAARQNDRMSTDASSDTIGTGFPTLDVILNGGLSKGEMGIWVAYAKCGKSTVLIQHGLAATRLALKNTAHFVFEGSRKQAEDRYDAAFMDEFYAAIKFGNCDAEKYSQAWQQAQSLKGLLRIRAFSDRWDHSVVDITDALNDWKRNWGWVPEVIIVDYGDLILGHDKKSYTSETEKQKAAFRDLKLIANRGYGLWTASQARRPGEGAEDKVHLIHARQIADCYEKVRVTDFLGSINATREERRTAPVDPNYPHGSKLPGRARLFAELYRDNAADKEIPVIFDGSRMRIYETPQLGYVQTSQGQVQQAAAYI